MNSMKMFSVYDRGTEQHNQPFFAINGHAAIRQLKNELRQQDSMLRAHATDFELFEVGTFDLTTGQITPNRERVARVEDLIERREGASE